MLKQLEIFNKLVSELKNDSTVEGVLLNGSVAAGTATEMSDLDMIVLADKNEFKSAFIDDVLVEIHYITFDKAVEKLKNNPMEVYKYLDARIEYDNGDLQKIIAYAEEIYNNYRASEEEKHEILSWLNSTRIKLKSAFFKQDMVLVSYLVSTNLWKVFEGVWAVNQKPIPPSGSLFRRYKDLEFIPFQNWFDELLVENIEIKGKAMIKCIDWILKALDK